MLASFGFDRPWPLEPKPVNSSAPRCGSDVLSLGSSFVAEVCDCDCAGITGMIYEMGWVFCGLVSVGRLYKAISSDGRSLGCRTSDETTRCPAKLLGCISPFSFYQAGRVA